MHSVSINKVQTAQAAIASLSSELDKTTEAVRWRAYRYFLERGGVDGKDLDDWLRAEREIIWTPGAEMTRDENTITLRVHAPGLDPEGVQITATPESIFVQAEAAHLHEAAVGEVCLCEFAEKFFRRFDLPEQIDVDNVSAKLEKGILQIVAVKAQAVKSRKPTQAAA